MSTRVRSFSKINLGLAIGPPRADGFHSLATLYQTLALYDLVTVSAQPARTTSITLSSNDARVPNDSRNTAWKMVERALLAAGVTAAVEIHIDKRLPVQGGMGAGSANAAAALLGLTRELPLAISPERRLAIAAEVGSDVPLFLIGGAVLGEDRGQIVSPIADLALAGQSAIPCVVALPALGVSTPLAFREWDRRFYHLTDQPRRDTLEELSRTYASVLLRPQGWSKYQTEPYGPTAIFPDPSLSAEPPAYQVSAEAPGNPEKLQGLTREQLHTGQPADHDQPQPAMSGFGNDLEALICPGNGMAGIENDFEEIVFAEHPTLREIKHLLTGDPASLQTASYAGLSGSGAALFGLYRSAADAAAAQHRLQQHGVQAIVTSTLARSLYWSSMFAG